jgi:hypothetical protein
MIVVMVIVMIADSDIQAHSAAGRGVVMVTAMMLGWDYNHPRAVVIVVMVSFVMMVTVIGHRHSRASQKQNSQRYLE